MNQSMETPNSFIDTIKAGLIAGVVVLSLCLIGIVESFNGRDVISENLTLAQILLFLISPIVAYMMARRQPDILNRVLHGVLAGALAAVPLLLLTLLTLWWVDIRDSFINVSPDLIEIITLQNESLVTGSLIMIGIFAVLAIVGVLFTFLNRPIQQAILNGVGWAAGIGLMSEILVNVLRSRLSDEAMDWFFGKSGINLVPALILAIGIALISYWWGQGGQKQVKSMQEQLPEGVATWGGRTFWIILLIIIIILPSFLGVYLTEIFNNVGLFILMGLGLNIAVGLAGLLDLGYVTNFAVGAYLMALFTSASEYGLETPISFWIALPICVLAAMFTGFIFALPVLRMRGDYLAIATLGFGEIIRVLARSDAMAWLIGGAQGILQIPKASIGGPLANIFGIVLNPINNFLDRWDLSILQVENGEIIFGKPPQLFYLIVLACLLMLVVSRRLNNSATGRRWMAMREDEDVAAAMGINTTNAKVIAFTLSAASGGLAGAIFAAKLGSIYPSSFQLLISINVLALIIVGGIGSLPGVAVGALALIGIPELLREFAEFRLLLYGVALIVMMLVRPEGLWPSEVQRRELNRSDDDVAPPLPGESVQAAGD